MNGIEYSKDPKNFFVRYNSPRRDFSDLRTEFNNDAVSISETCGPVYIGFSSGVDSQIMARCFIDMNLDAEYIFLHSVGFNDLELSRTIECEKYYGIKVTKYEININDFRDQWISKSNGKHMPSMYNYPFEWLSKQLPEPWPFVMQGTAEPAIIGTSSLNASIYHNYYDFMEQRTELMQPFRRIIDFPFSPESIASYYTDSTTKLFCETLQYLHENPVSSLIPEYYKDERYLQYFNTYAKSFVKGKYFSKDIKWFGKLTGSEGYPDWFKGYPIVSSTRVSVPYWDLVDFLENTRNSSKEFSGWAFKNAGVQS